MRPRYAILVDGGFMRTNLLRRPTKSFTADDVVRECDRLRSLPCVKDYELLRIFYYDAQAKDVELTAPVSGSTYNAMNDDKFRNTRKLHDQLILKPDFALRIGELSFAQSGWRLKPNVATKLAKQPRPLTDEDFTLNVQQKGVDMRIGMDMARLALREMVRTVIVVTGDTDFVPAFKFMRREGVRVILDLLGEQGRPELRQHSDLVV
jgi:uncharacterized LabA/DUF88 family protein